ncbi:MAG TPA: NAD-binding protein [Herpetosiphonaceae bacterium]
MLATLGRLRTGFVLLALVLGIGTIGYLWLEDFSPLEAFYATLLVVSTLGFSQILPRTPGGIALTIVLIFSGVGTLYYLLGSFAEALIETSLGTQRERRMERQIARLRKHYIVCGYGRVGRHAAHELSSQHQPFVVVDNDPEGVEYARSEGCLAMFGDATEDRVLQQAGVERARGLLIATASDAANVFITLSARALNSRLLIVARANDEPTESKLLKAGADKVIAPEVVGGQRMAALILRPETTDLVDTLTLSHDSQSWIDEALIDERSALNGLTLGDSSIHSRTGARVIAIRRSDGTLITNPDSHEQLRSGDVLISVGDRDQLAQVEALTRSTPERVGERNTSDEIIGPTNR